MGDTSWPELRRFALDAAEASLARLLPDGQAHRLSEEPAKLPPSGRQIELWPVGPKVYWKQQLIFLVDHGIAEADQVRHQIDQRYVGVNGRKVSIALSAKVRQALGDASEVDVLYRSTFEIERLQALIVNLRRARTGELVAALWNGPAERVRPVVPAEVRTSRPLDAEQSQVLAAMTSPGGWFVCGPPGTGTTMVVGAAVRDAVAHGRSVLIASALHVAVDDVVDGLLRDDDMPPLLQAPGDVVRLAGGATTETVLPVVREHDFALIDKAAAFETSFFERRERLLSQCRDNECDLSRERLRAVLARLAGADASALAAASAAVVAAQEAEQARGEHEAGRRALGVQELAVQQLARQAAAAASRRGALAQQVKEARAVAGTLPARLLPPLGRARLRAAGFAEARLAEADSDRLAIDAQQGAAGDALRELRVRCACLAAVFRARERQSELCRRAAEDSGLIATLSQRDGLDDEVERLDGQLEQLERELAQLDAELRRATERILQTSGVVATTIDGLSMNRSIRQRRFDVVILEEGGSISAAAVAYAGSLARRTFVVVGDFLHRTPIAEIATPSSAHERRLADWQCRSVFELAGIHDRATAERHPACVALHAQSPVRG